MQNKQIQIADSFYAMSYITLEDFILNSYESLASDTERFYNNGGPRLLNLAEQEMRRREKERKESA